MIIKRRLLFFGKLCRFILTGDRLEEGQPERLLEDAEPGEKCQTDDQGDGCFFKWYAHLFGKSDNAQDKGVYKKSKEDCQYEREETKKKALKNKTGKKRAAGFDGAANFERREEKVEKSKAAHEKDGDGDGDESEKTELRKRRHHSRVLRGGDKERKRKYADDCREKKQRETFEKECADEIFSDGMSVVWVIGEGVLPCDERERNNEITFSENFQAEEKNKNQNKNEKRLGAFF